MRKLSLLAVAILLLSVSTGAASTGAAADAASPVLTGTEYQQLLTFQSAAASLKSAKTVAAVVKARKSCRGLSRISALMRADRADCTATFGWIEASIKALASLRPCAHRRTVSSRFVCLTPAYARLSRSVGVLYRSERGVHRAVRARGFTGACGRALSNGPRAIAHEEQMAKDISKMVSAMRKRDVLATQKWGSLYDAATAESESASSKVSVAVCAHR